MRAHSCEDAARDFRHVRRVVVKVGTKTVSKSNGDANATWARSFAAQVRSLRARRIEVVIVSSGAIGAGRYELGLKKRPTALPEKQAAAAVGQARLMRVYTEAFKQRGIAVAQILLTYGDLDSKQRCQNARTTINTLLRMGVVPIINENDTVAVEEIKFGDNDHLSALTCELIEADLLVLLTDVQGLLERGGGGKSRRPLPLIDDRQWDAAWRAVEAGTNSHGTGGMHSKLQAAQRVVAQGGRAIIACGKLPHVLERIIDGEQIGTCVVP